MVTVTRPGFTALDEELSEQIAAHAAAYQRRAEKRHFAETGMVDPINKDREATEEVLRLLEMARPELDGDEEAAMHRLLDALEETETGAR